MSTWTTTPPSASRPAPVPSSNVVAAASTPAFTQQFWLLSDGEVTSPTGPTFGRLTAPPQPPVAIASSGSGKGYWIALRDGAVHAFGDAPKLPGTKLASPVVAMSATSSGRGYWLASADGTVAAVGDAPALGGASSKPAQPVVSMVTTPDGGGYWLLTKNGEVHPVGTARFHGAATGRLGSATTIGILCSPTGGGYVIAASDGKVWSFGDAPQFTRTLPAEFNPAVALVRAPFGVHLVSAKRAQFTL